MELGEFTKEDSKKRNAFILALATEACPLGMLLGKMTPPLNILSL